MKAALLKADARQFVKSVVNRVRGKPSPRLTSRVRPAQIKKMIANTDLAIEDGQVTWFYTAYNRGDDDPLTNYTLDWIVGNIDRDARILNTGCGTGIMLFWLIDQGFGQVDGFDVLEDCVIIANRVKEMGGYETLIWRDDGFAPKGIEGKYDLITAMHWVYSAWMGNYGNTAAEKPKSPEMRERLLNSLLSAYVPHLAPGGRFIVELTDAIGDYRVPNDHPYLRDVDLDAIYPVRHSPEQVERVAGQNGLDVEFYYASTSYSHHPRASYILRLQG